MRCGPGLCSSYYLLGFTLNGGSEILLFSLVWTGACGLYSGHSPSLSLAVGSKFSSLNVIAPQEVLRSCLSLEPKAAAGALHCSTMYLTSCNVQELHLSVSHLELALIAAVTLMQWFWKRWVEKMGNAEGALLLLS